jgi:hypothetical protein
MPRTGRPPKPLSERWADDQLEELLGKLTKGVSLTEICQDPKMPQRRTVYEWIESDADFAARFRVARAQGVHALVDQCLEIADEKAEDAVQVANKRVRIDTRLRLAGKWLPKDYGDKIDVNYNAEVTHRHDLSGYTADELDALEKLIAKAPNAEGDTSGASQAKSGSVH